ncbi:hypothetical protein R1sor_000928 [Riccia sorocarpa]|uniref:Potassium transporter n=1 Tax=Riccia sorocarpa TaxID=122646 RepID=A0ABD3GWH9_9MARC
MYNWFVPGADFACSSLVVKRTTLVLKERLLSPLLILLGVDPAGQLHSEVDHSPSFSLPVEGLGLHCNGSGRRVPKGKGKGDSPLMDVERGTPPGGQKYQEWRRASYYSVLGLAYQSFGVVYGDLCISPLYVYKSVFAGGLRNQVDQEVVIFGVLSFIFWTLTMVPLIKYILIVLAADDNGEGGTFALYSLLCRHAKLSLLPNQQSIDEELSQYRSEPAVPCRPAAAVVKAALEKNKFLRTGLLILVLLGTCMVIGDGILTPAISVLSAVNGLQLAAPGIHDNWMVLLACIILLCLFYLQHHGTRRVAFIFAPVVITWLLCISGIGVYNVIHHNPSVFRALSPHYMWRLFKICGKDGWIALGGVVLCITGTEAMFADLGHFSQLSIKIAFTGVVYPGLVLSYMGQAAYLTKHPQHIQRTFYRSIPKPIYWPVLVISTLAAVVGSQAVISATFSIIKQCQSLGCFPRVKVIHTSNHIHGQIYIPEMNWLLLILSLAVTIGFKDTTQIGNAYGIAVVTVMLVTTFLMFLIIIIVWKKNVFLAAAFLLVFGSIEVLYISACLIKVPQGGWVPLVLSAVFMIVMYCWHYGITKKYEFDNQNKVSMKWILALGPSLGIVRVPGMGLIYSELVTGVPAIFSHFVTNLPAFHKVLVLVCIKSVPVPHVGLEQRYLVSRIGPREYRMYRCIVRYGYKDVHEKDRDFEKNLIESIAQFIQFQGGSGDAWVSSSNENSVEAELEETQGAAYSAHRRNMEMLALGTNEENQDDPDYTSSVRSFAGYQDTVRAKKIDTSIMQDAAGDEQEESSSGRSSPIHSSSEQEEADADDEDSDSVERKMSFENVYNSGERASAVDSLGRKKKVVRFEVEESSSEHDPEVGEELAELYAAREAGVAYVLGHSYVKAKAGSSWFKKAAVDYVYTFLKNNCRGPGIDLSIPHLCLIEVGMVYYV